MSESTKNKILFSMAEKILAPLICYMLKQQISFNAFNQIVKRVYVKTAKEHFSLPGKKQTVSRIATITGVTRHEVARLNQETDLSEVFEGKGESRAGRVISGWLSDKQFYSTLGEPDVLPFELEPDDRTQPLGEMKSFTDLVHKYAGDVTPKAIYDELLNNHMLKIQDSGLLQPINKSYIPNDELEKLSILGEHTALFLQTGFYNIQNSSLETPLHMERITYELLPNDTIEYIKERIEKESLDLLNSIDKQLSTAHALTKDNPSNKCKVGVGVYYFEQS